MEWDDPFRRSYGSIKFDDDWSMNPTTGSWGFGDMPMDDRTTGGDYGGQGGEMPTFSKGCMSFGGSFIRKVMFQRKRPYLEKQLHL